MDYLEWRLGFILTVLLGWIFYIIYRYRKSKDILAYWGFRRDNFKQALKTILPFSLLAFAAFIVIGYFQGTLNPSWHILPLLLLYPIWGVMQQFLVISLVAGNLADLQKPRLNKFLVILLTAIIFAGIHFPTLWLVYGTFVLALYYGFVFLKVRNVYALGILHGWLGALFFYTVVDKDPFLQVFGAFVK